MKPYAIGIITALIVGAAVGAGMVLLAVPEPLPPVATPAPAPPPPKTPEKPVAMAALPDPELDKELESLRGANAALNAQIQDLKKALSEKEAAASANPGTEVTPGENSDAFDEDFWRDFRRRVQPDGPEAAQMLQRMQEFRDGVNSYYEDAIAQATEPEAQERLAALQDYTEQLFDIRQQFRQADDATREKLREEMRTLRDEMAPLQREQQDYLLRRTAAAHGLEKPGEQNRFIRDLRSTMQDPIFMQGGRGGGGGGGFNGGRQGGGNRGGGGGGDRGGQQQAAPR